MIFISMLKRYMAIFIIFLTGMVLSVAGVFYFGGIYGLGGSMLGFASGQVVAMLLLFILSLLEYSPSDFKSAFKNLFLYFANYKFLLLCGLFYYWAIWIDKFLYWFLSGYKIKGTLFMLFDAYDIPVYLANLSMIPGLIYFVVISETDFYDNLKDFLDSLSKSILSVIQEKRIFLIERFKKGLLDQGLFQGIFTLIFIITAPYLNFALFGGTINLVILRITFIAVYFHFLYLTFMTFMFYMELYWQSALTSFIFFAVNTSYCLITELTGHSTVPGLSYLYGGIAATIIALIFLFTSIKSIDQRIFSNYN
jgi:polysaccharide biosynthesis protein PelG